MESLQVLSLITETVTGNPELLTQLFQTAYASNGAGADVPLPVLEKTAGVLNVTVAQAGKIFAALTLLIHTVLFEGIASKERVVALLPASLDAALQKLIVKAIAANLPAWRTSTDNSQCSSPATPRIATVSLPRLKDFDWRVDLKLASEHAPRMAVPTCLVQMTVEDSPEQEGTMTAVNNLVFEVNKETLATMLDGLGKIREQLGSLVQAS